ncbi:HD domain-containing protein [Streptomyces sp. TRM76323]|uniref:HD domain-containing protein n=1 Tax=Streptomyces tamarix TaxID=3078565 RepID=A0ABU3QDE3_9ACTN|nr:HD domain-containing phosphohydrolase [Streptomyces tamarix]MDT9680774.1 HD domain-containing protein [Streptomyces tamarix]
MAGIPGAARAYIAGAALAAAACALPALAPASATPWGSVALLAGLYAFCESPARSRLLAGTANRVTGRPAGARAAGGAPPAPAGCYFPVLLAAALLLPPAAAALVAVPGALFSPVGDRRPARPRRVWRAARLALAVWAAARTAALLGGPAAVDRTPDLPYALLPAGAAVLVFCVVLTALDGGILATAERVPPRAAWRGILGRSLAAHAAHGLVGLMTAVLWRSPYGWPAALFTLLPMYVTCWAYTQYHRERAAHQATIRALVQAVDLKDTYTRGHSERVGRASVMIGRELGMDEDRLEVLRFAGTLHDVGKIGVPTRVLRKDGPLTREERRIIELHPEYGHEVVRGIGFLGEARSAILHHHERLDGKGYPYGLRGAEIPEPARVVAVADAFDAMTSTRSYSRARPVPAALAELARCAGTQFDPAMVDALTRALARHGWEATVTSDEPLPSPAGPPVLRALREGPTDPGATGGGAVGHGPARGASRRGEP